jgi:hypothetical protein
MTCDHRRENREDRGATDNRTFSVKSFVMVFGCTSINPVLRCRFTSIMSTSFSVAMPRAGISRDPQTDRSKLDLDRLWILNGAGLTSTRSRFLITDAYSVGSSMVRCTHACMHTCLLGVYHSPPERERWHVGRIDYAPTSLLFLSVVL